MTREIFKKIVIAVTYVLILLTLAGASAAIATDFRICEDCHFERLEQDRGRLYQHHAFAVNDCSSCHVSAGAIPSPGQSADTPLAGQQERIGWITDSIAPGTSHYFLLAGEGLRDTLIISLRGQQGQVHREEIPLPLLEQMRSAEDNGSTPQLANVRVMEIKRGVFLSVTIAWQTDELAAAEVRFGTTELNQRIDSGGRLGFEHQLVLQQLQPDKTYRYQVIARDLFGRERVSEIRTFSTTRMMPRRQVSDPEIENADAPTVMVDMLRRGDDYLLEVQLDQPRAVSVGSKGERRDQPREISAAVVKANKNPHVGLSAEAWRSMASCHQCHVKDEAASHPVNVLPPPGMIIPPEYPTLADGRMTCASCHAIHGSDQEYLTRQRSKRELCVGCHLDML